MPDFVDIHSHVLYGLDDGASTIDESIAMLEMARDTGTTDIVATPHADTQYAFDPQRVEARIAELSSRVSGITIHRGCDFRLEVSNIEEALRNPTKFTINHRNYLLVEFPHMTVFPSSGGIFAKLLDAGMTPIITHPERNAFLQQNPDEMTKFVDAGCLAQVTAASCTGTFGKRVQATAHALMQRNVVHFIASDAHDLKNRTPDLSRAYALLTKQWGEARVRPLFVDNPRAVLSGQEVDVWSAGPMSPTKKWYEFWR